jgi:chromosome segregation protein
MMRLKSIELHGYKTFASQTSFEFAGMVTAIVGPNGSGKSNVADSLRWVLGEQSYSLLRGKKTEDMIFSGSEFRPRAGMASATVVFDNSDGWLPIDFSEVSITRRAYRDGQNEYLVNGQRVRLKDVTELLAQSGLAERTYTIIGQGVVDAALSLKAEERRRLFEEAAGIGLYRARREEAQRRLETTRRNLERVQDILAELQPRLRSLERQARRAQEYEQIRADLRLLLREWYGYHWHQAQKELHENRDLARKQEIALDKARKSYQELDQKISIERSQLQSLRARLNGWHRQLAGLHTQREELSTQRAVAAERLRSLVEQRQSAQAELARLQDEVELHHGRLHVADEEVALLEVELDEAHGQAESALVALGQRQDERAQAEADTQAARQALESLNKQLGEGQARLAERRAQTERQTVEQRLVEAAQERAQQEYNAALAAVRASESAHNQARDARQKAEAALHTQSQHRFEAEASRQKLLDKQAARSADLASLMAQLDVLEKAENTLSGYARGAQALLKAFRQGLLSGARGAFSNFIEVSADLEIAIAAALGEFVDALVLENAAGVDAGLGIMQAESARGALLPLADITPPEEIFLGDAGEEVIGVASKLVTAPAELRPAVEWLLGRTLVVRDRSDALHVLKGYRNADGLRVVTLKGEVFHASGPVQAGSDTAPMTLARPRQRKSLQEQIGALQKQLDDLTLRLDQFDATLKEVVQVEARLEKELLSKRDTETKAFSAHSRNELALEAARRQIDWHTDQANRLKQLIGRASDENVEITSSLVQLETQINQRREDVKRRELLTQELSLDEFQSQVAYWNTQIAVAQRALDDARSRRDERIGVLEGSKKSIEEVENRIQQLEASIRELESEKTQNRHSETEVTAQIDALLTLLNPAEAELDLKEGEQESMQSSEAAARQELSKAEHHHAQARIALARRQEAVETWRRRIEDDFGLVAFEYSEEVSGPTPLPMGEMVEQLPRIKHISPDLEENLRRLRAQLRRMGAINPEAQAEYLEVKQRFEFMTEQVTDLRQAEEDVQQVILELDELMQRELRRTFEAVAEEFSIMFKRLFAGGSARLVLTDPEDMASTGIDIEARLPGKRMQGLSLLSGGERSLTASALVFALLKVSPTPFCLLDEVDAMLDEANVGRFRELLRELSQGTQFIVVTHNRSTVQVADVIYGVTMGRDSSSQVISLKIEEVEKVIE